GARRADDRASRRSDSWSGRDPGTPGRAGRAQPPSRGTLLGRLMPALDRARIVETMNSMVWYHRIELAPGIVTPGADWEALWAPMRERHRAVDFRGKRVLEIGCWDGYWSFEAEKLGAAEVWATDDMSQRKTVPRSVPFAL